MAKKTEAQAQAPQPDLDRMIEDAEGAQHQQQPLEPPPIQGAGGYPSIADAMCSMDQPPPAPPKEHHSLNHGTMVPRSAFRVKPREGKGLHLYMFNMPWGTAGKGEPFTHAIAGSLLEQLRKECPALVPQRFEIRLVLEAGDDMRYSLLEVPADKAGTRKAEEVRRGLLHLLAKAEKEWRIAEKVAGHWDSNPAAYDWPVSWPAQNIFELGDLLVYGPLIHRSLDVPVFLPFRKAKPAR
jgi:hypothetical protein